MLTNAYVIEDAETLELIEDENGQWYWATEGDAAEALNSLPKPTWRLQVTYTTVED